MNEAFIQQDFLVEQNNNISELDEGKQEANVTEIIIAKHKADNVQMLLPMLA